MKIENNTATNVSGIEYSNNILGYLDIVVTPENNKMNHCGIKCGPIKLPEGCYTECGELIVFGENEDYLHCIFSKTGSYYGIYKSPDTNHIYHEILRINL